MIESIAKIVLKYVDSMCHVLMSGVYRPIKWNHSPSDATINRWASSVLPKFKKKIVTERCKRGCSIRTRWATQDQEFLMNAYDPFNLRHLSKCLFGDLKTNMNRMRAYSNWLALKIIRKQKSRAVWRNHEISQTIRNGRNQPNLIFEMDKKCT